MPKRIVVIGIIFCLAGIFAIWEMIQELSQSHFSLNLVVFLLPVGIELLQGRPNALRWARSCVFLGYFSCVLMIGLAIFLPENLEVQWLGQKISGPEAVPYVFTFKAVFIPSLITIHKLLYSKKALEYFNR